MTTRFLTRYFAFVLSLYTSAAVVKMILELRDGTGTPMYLLGFTICAGLFLIANRLAHQRRWAVAAFSLFCALGAHESNVSSTLLACLFLAHTIAGVLHLLLRGRELKPGL